MSRSARKSRSWASSVVAGAAFAASCAMQGCGLNPDLHFNSNEKMTDAVNADMAFKAFVNNNAGINQAAEADITALMQLQQTVDSAHLEYEDSSEAYDAPNQTWLGLRASFLQSVGMLKDGDPLTVESVAAASDDLDAAIALRLVKVATITDLLNKLVKQESDLADQEQKNLQASVNTLNSSQSSGGATTITSGNTDAIKADALSLSNLEAGLLKAAKAAAQARSQASNLTHAQQCADQTETELLAAIESSRDSDVVAALAPLIRGAKQ